jgi:serine/threonine protein kinase
MRITDTDSMAGCDKFTFICHIETKKNSQKKITGRISIVIYFYLHLFLVDIFIYFSLAEPALDLFDRMLELDPAKRISADDALQSAWLKDLGDDHIRPLQ